MHWLLKAEPESRIVKGHDVKYTIDDLKKEKIGVWDGVRNYEARKHMLAMKRGDEALFYRSNCKEPAVVGTMKIAKEAYPDKSASDPGAAYYEPKHPEKWVAVDVEYMSHLKRSVSLREIKETPELGSIQLIKRSRLSVIPITDEEWNKIIELSKEVHAENGTKTATTRKSAQPDESVPEEDGPKSSTRAKRRRRNAS